MQQPSLEYRLQESDRLCFIHIPKTAGTTFTTIIDAQFHLNEISPDPRFLKQLIPQQFEQVNILESPDTLKPFKLIRGHFSYGFIQPLLPPNTRYLTILRNPLDQAISLYQFFKRARERGEPESEDYQLLMEATSQGLKHFLLHPHPTVQRWTSNLQTRFLGSRFPDLPEPSDAEMLTAAQHNLSQFTLVGLTEKFQEAIALLNYTFGWYPSVSYPSLRVATKKPWKDNLEPELMHLLQERNQLDIDLYQYAESIFQERFSLMLEQLKARYFPIETSETSIEQLQPFLEKHYQQRFAEKQLCPISVINFDFRQPISGTGWHQRNGKFNGLEHQQPVFRWTGPVTDSTLDFPLAKQEDLVIKLRVNNAIAPDVLQSLTFAVNQHLIPLRVLANKGKQTFFYGVISKAALESTTPFTRLTFKINHTAPYRSLNPNNPDDRWVGLAFSQIQIFPASAHPGDPRYLSLLFPFHDPNWAEVVNFVQTFLQPSDKLAAPTEFIEPFPEQWVANTTPFDENFRPSWVILHKSHLSEINAHSLKWTVKTLKPVFVNAVFVIFSNSPVLKKVSSSTELDSFLLQFKSLERIKTLSLNLKNRIRHSLKTLRKRFHFK